MNPSFKQTANIRKELAFLLKSHSGILKSLSGTIIVANTDGLNVSLIFMKIIKNIFWVLSLMCLVLPIYSQDNASVPERTPEQEASRQTEKLQQELNLTQEQSRKVYEINVRYERQRQISNSRSEAMERIKNKNADMQKVLTEEQNNRLQNKRYERTTIDIPSSIRNPQTLNSSGYPSTTQYRTRTSSPVTSTDRGVRSNFRGTNTQNPGRTEYQSVRRSTPTTRETPRIQSNPTSTRSAVPSYNPPTRTETNSARSSSTYSAPTRTETNSAPRSTPSDTPSRTSTPSTTNRR